MTALFDNDPVLRLTAQYDVESRDYLEYWAPAVHPAACTLLEELPRGAVVLGDANYDSRFLYADVRERGGWLLTRLKGRSRQPRNLNRMGEARRGALDAWRTNPALCERVLHLRDGVERRFGHLTSFGGGLGPLPSWVRRLRRVRLWVDAKIAVYHARLIARSLAIAA